LYYVDPPVVEELGRGAPGPDDVHLILPSDDHGVVAAPLQVLGRDLGLGVVLAEAGLEVTRDDVRLTRLGVQRGELAVRADTDVGEGADVQELVLAVRGVDNVDGLSYAEQDLDGPR
jgi:hypothetical protein